MNSVWARRPRVRALDVQNLKRGRRLAVALSSALAGALLTFSTASVAAPVPGTPDPVAAGVPGYGRAWELVTPPDVTPERVFAGIGEENPVMAVSTTGDRVAYETVSTSPDGTYGGLFVVNMAERRADGWVSATLEAPYPELNLLGPRLFKWEGALAFDPELRTSIWGNKLPTPESEVGLFTRAADGTYSPLGRIGETGGGAIFIGASKDLQRVFFESTDHLLPADATRTQGVSIYEISDSTMHLVNVEDDGSLVSNCGARTIDGSGTLRSTNSISFLTASTSDGLKMFFVSNPDCGEHARVYLRAGGHTTEISASQCTLPDPECGPEQDVSYVGATPSGSVAYIATAQRLTDDDSNAYQDLYRYDASDGKLTLLDATIRRVDRVSRPVRR